MGLQKIARLLMDEKVGVIKSTLEIDAVGHRVVHGGSSFTNTVVINEEVKVKIKQLFELAPLHNPANLEGINVASEIFDTAKQVAVFDTAFHQTIPVVAYKYAVPNYLLTENKIRVYGFHGTSHKYVSEKAIDYLENSSKIITIHLGNGCSMTAIKDGKSVDHTLGFGPMNGLIMGTRSGDIDQSVIFYMVNSLGYSLADVNTMLQKQSGMLGLTGFSDLRDIQSSAEQGNAACQLALEMNAYRIKKYIGSYSAALNGLDAIIFTAGIGENSSLMRQLVCKDMEYFGMELDAAKNEIRSAAIREINTPQSKTKIMVIPTNEEIEIANQVYELLLI
jgi:acetate kinase